MERLLILDSNSLMNRAFYAIQAELTTSEGIHTNAVYGFMNMLIKMKEDIKPDYIVAAFDKKGPTFRHKEYSDYKAGRKKMPPELSEQFPIIKELLGYLGISIYEVEGFEADDIIGTVSTLMEKEGMEVYIVTGDKDALQLASENINVVITKKGVSETAVYNKENFIKEFEVTPNQFIDVKGLMGDKSDNIPGVPGVGEKTAFKLIKTYGSIEGVLDNIDNISGKKLKENLSENREQAIFSKKLATIITEMPVEFDKEEIMSLKTADLEAAKRLMFKLQLKSIVPKIVTISGEDISANDEIEDIDFKEVLEEKDIEEILNTNIETVYINYFAENMSNYNNMNVVELVLLMNDKVYIVKGTENILKLKDLFINEQIKKIVHDGKLLITFLEKNNISLNGFEFDTCIAAYLLDSSKGKYPMEFLINEYLGEEAKGEEDKLKASIIYKMPRIYGIIRKKIEDENMNSLYYDMEHPLIKALSSMEQVGFKVNKEKLDELAKKFKEDIEKTEAEIYKLAEEKFNINSPKQLGKILFEKLDLPVIKKTKTGYSTNADVLEKLKDKHEIIPKITYYRQITKLNSTYVEGLKNVIEEDGCIHSNFNQTVTTTGRLSSTEPNLQNIPIKYEMGREIRKVFIPKEAGDKILACDYSQIELRVLAHMSGDENMIEAYNHHSDIHTKTASEVFGVDVSDVTSIMRSSAKAVNFGIVYGISDFSLAQDIGVTKKEASEYMTIYFERYPKIKTYLEEVQEDAKKLGYVVTMFNRRRFIPEIKSSNKIVKALGERLAMNAPIQGTAADIIKLAMVNVDRKIKELGLKSQIILQVHDELILNVKESELELVKELVKKEMEEVVKISIPLEVDLNLGNTWYEAK